MLGSSFSGGHLRDIPVCFPGRRCVDQTPVGAHLLDLTSALTPSSATIAALSLVVLGASVVLVATGLRLQWRGAGLRPWMVVLVAGLLLVGVAVTWAADVRLESIAAIYSDLYGQPRAPVPASLVGAWPEVRSAASTLPAVGGATVVAVIAVAGLRSRRARST